MLTTYFLGGLIDYKNCKTRVDATKSSGDKLPDGVEYIISVDAELKKSPKEVKKAFSAKGYPRCKVNDLGCIVWFSKNTSEEKFKLPEMKNELIDSTTIVGFKQPMFDFLNQSMSKSPGRVRIESSASIKFKDEPLNLKDRIYPSLSISRLLKFSKVSKIQFRNQILIDTKDSGDKSIIDAMSSVSEFRQLITNSRPFIKSIRGLKIITKDATVTIKIHHGFHLDWFPQFNETPNDDIPPLMFDCLSEIIETVSSMDRHK